MATKATKKILTMSEELQQITGCPAEDVKKVEFLMREKHRILGELTRAVFNRAAREAYDVLKHIRTATDDDSKWLLNYVNENT